MQGAEGAVEAARSDDFTAFPVSYVDDVGIWKDVEPVFRGCMPLKNLNWKRRSSGGQYLLGTVDLAFHPYDAQQLNWGGFLPLGSPMVNYYRKPYLYIYFAICEDNDVYRDVLRPKLTEWTNLHTAKQQEWLIIHVQGRQSLGKSAIGALNSAFNRSPFDKIRDDFRRVVQLRLTEKDDKRREMVDGLSSKLSECFLSALDQRVSEYEEEIRKMLQRRMVPGWNYCTFFLVKEALAIICEAASLLDEALLQYTELEVLFNEEVNGKQPNRMAVFFPPEPEASSVFRWEIIGLVAPTKRPYREMLSKNSISEFEFLEYLFARQLHLWFGLDRISDVTSRTHHFISDMERRFRLHAASLPPTFANAWMCCAAQCLVDKCTAWFQSNPLSPNLSAQRPSVTTSNTSSGKMIPEITITTLSAAEADLYHLARLKLDRLGAQSGLLEVNSSRINMGRIGRMTAETLAQPSPAATPLPAELPLRLGVAARHMRHASGQIRPEDLAPPTASIDLKGSDDAGAFPPPAVPALASAPATFSSTQFAPPPPPALTLPAIPAPEAAPEAKKPVATEEPDKATLSPRQRSASVSTNQRSRRPYDPPIGGPGPGAALKKALQSGAEFDSLYIELSECAAIRYRESFRSRHVITVNNDVASLYMERGRFADAEALLKSISQVLFSEGWHALNLYALAKLAECQRALNHHFEYISTCLSILSLPVDAHSHASQDIARFYQTELLNIASNLQQPVLRDMHPTFNVTINTKGAATRSLVVGELLSVECDLSTLLPEPIVVDSVQLKFAERASSTAVNARAAVSQSSEGIEAGRRASLRSVFLQSPGKVTLPPGSQKAVRVRLERRLMDAGEFTVERILLHIGQLGLTHVLRQVPLSISVAQSHPSLELSLVHDKGDRQVIGQSKPIHLIVKTNLDAVQSGSLVVSLLSGSSSQLASASFTPQFVLESLKKSAYFLIHHASEDLSQAKRVPFTLAPTATATVVSAPVSDVPPNHMLHFYIDLLMPMSQSEENVAFKKEISCKLKYLKVPDGKYEVEATEELRFQPPFAVAATLHPTGAKDRMMLQIECKNTLWTAAAVRKYALALAGGVKVIADPNGGLLKGYDLAARHVLSLSFIVQVEPGTTEVTGGLTLDYTTPLAQECQPFYHPIKLPIVIPRQLQIEIATRSPPSCTVASFFLLEYVVQRLDDGGEPVQVRCEVAADSKEWMLAGRRKNSFELRAGERRVFAFRAMAVRCGYLLLPVMTLRNAPAVFVDRAKQIHIFPLSHRPLVEIAQHAKTL